MKRTTIIISTLLLLSSARAATISVTNTNDSGPGSLRAAITQANGTVAADTITFNITGPGFTIIPSSSALPTITQPVAIDGYTQPGASSNTLANGDNATLLIELNAAILGNNADGLVLAGDAGGSTIRGLVIDNGFSRGILIQTNDVVVEGCFIGTDPTGRIAHGNTQGVAIDSGFANACRVGGTLPGQRNVICGNGIGIFIQAGSGTNHIIQGNFIGLDATGTNALANSTAMDIRTSDNLIGGTNAAARNVIAGNGSGNGIVVSGGSGNRIQGNFIGTDFTGTHGLGLDVGIALNNTETAALVGGLTATPGTPPGNVIAASGVSIAQAKTGNTIEGNLIGTDATGTKALGSPLDGVQIFGVANVISNNVISASGRHGILLGTDNSPVHDNPIKANFIGTDITGTNLLGNSSDGVFVSVSFDNTIESNIIAGNGAQGVDIVNGATNIAVLGNSIFANGGLGIDLGTTGVTPNDLGGGDADPGDNHLQNFPVLTTAVTGSGTVTLGGFLDSTPNTTFRLEFFSNTKCDPTGFGEGEQFLGFTNVTTAANGTNNFSVKFNATPTGPVFTATATDPTGNTSEFSADFPPNLCVPDAACSLLPALTTNSVGQSDSVTVTVTSNNVPIDGISVTFNLTGANGTVQTNITTTGGGHATFSYTGKNAGIDSILAAGGFSSAEFACDATKVWIQACPTITLSPATLPNGTVGVPYSQTIAAGGSTATPISFTNTVGALPAGLNLSSAGILSGTPSAQGTSGFTITATDTNNCTGNRSYLLTIDAVAQPCTITCPSDIVSNTASGLCGATVTYAAGSSGICPAIVLDPASGSFFQTGTNTVTATTNGVFACSFNVIVHDTERPHITCPGNITSNVAADAISSVVNFAFSATDNCALASSNCSPASGSVFGLGTTNVTCTATDTAGNTTNCIFTVTVHAAAPETHDLALIKLKAPKNINLNAAGPALTKFVKVTFQNRSPHDEAITDLTGLITLVAESLGTNCPNATVVLHPGPPNNPKTLKPKQKMTVTLDVTYNCANDKLKGTGHEDFRYLAAVHHEAIDGNADTHPEDDGCPRAALPGGTDSNPDPRKPLKDTGCAGGIDVKTDVFEK
jgi:parallel beta-helix repeat protein